MYVQTLPQNILYYMLYAAVAMTEIIACCYLLMRRANAFAPDNTPPVRLRRWAAAFFASMVLSHLWYLPSAFFTSSNHIKLSLYIGALLDLLIFLPTTICVMLVMLQDRRRPLWPVPLMTIPPVIVVWWCIINRSATLVPAIYAYLLLLVVGLIIYLVRAMRQYGRWLRDNYADLENKEVWQTFIAMSVTISMLSYYVWGVGNNTSAYILQIAGLLLTYFLLWRVETLHDLSITQAETSSVEPKIRN